MQKSSNISVGVGEEKGAGEQLGTGKMKQHESRSPELLSIIKRGKPVLGYNWRRGGVIEGQKGGGVRAKTFKQLTSL